MNHAWSDPDRTDPHLTLRICKRCGMRRLTDKSRAAKGRYSVRFASAEGLAYHGERTPPCLAVIDCGPKAVLSPVETEKPTLRKVTG